MSAGPETSTDIVAVACVIEASLLIASEWTRILIEYVYPLLKRLNELYPSHQFRLAFVTYGAADTRPQPLLTKRFFAPLSLVTRELRDEPSKLGIGQTNSGSGRGLSALEGLVAAIELFDILMASINSSNHAQTQSPQKEGRSLISHLLHIAGSPPDGVQRPQCNTLQHLDFVNWDAIPAELRKRKINLSLISLRKIPQFQDLHSAQVASSGVQSPWFNVHAPHVLSLTGFPTPQKGVKRQGDTSVSDHSPDAKRQKVVTDPVSKALSASPSLSSARVPQNPRTPQLSSSQVAQPHPASTSAPNTSSAQPIQASVPATGSTPASTSSGPLTNSGASLPDINAEVLEQVVTTTGMKFGQMLERLKALERIISAMDVQISNAQKSGQADVLAVLQKDRTDRSNYRDMIRSVLRQHYVKMTPEKEFLNVQSGLTGSTLPGGLAEAGPSAQSHPLNVISSEPSMGPSMEEHKSTMSDSQIVAQFWQSRGGTVAAPSGTNPPAGPSQIQSHPTITSEVTTQVAKGNGQKEILPQVSGAASQMSGAKHDAGVRPNNQLIHWGGTFVWKSSKVGGQVGIEVQIHVLGISSTSDIRTDLWPNNLVLNSCKEPVKDETELISWVRRHQPRSHMVQFKSNPRAPDGSVNEKKFHAVHKYMTDHRIYAYTGWHLSSGKFSYNMFIFPMGSSFAGVVFSEGIPDLPGSGNILDAQPLSEEARTQPPRGLNIHPSILARIQGIEPARRREVFTRLMREHIQRQQLQQIQQSHSASSQAPNLLGISIPANMYDAVASVSEGLHTNAIGPTITGSYNTVGGTVNSEMLRSFMQRNEEGATSQGMDGG